MKLWVETDSVHSAGRSVRAKVSEAAAGISRQAASRGVRAVNALRNAELNVLKGQRSGKRYRKYPYKSMYTASAPGEPPARRTGNLRVEIIAELESQEPYAAALENGTSKMAPRPFVEKIKEEAAPEIQRIYSEHYT